ncbi:MAG: WhiB family transcriptional regulator [Actinobacteria bacterium]|nr:WhiB family transcriptional regulator [Actinomycetota bacterium]
MDWLRSAACISEEPELFFPVGSSDDATRRTARAKEVCRRCPVIHECLEWSLATAQDAGVWGGRSEEERREIRRERRRAAALTAAG